MDVPSKALSVAKNIEYLSKYIIKSIKRLCNWSKLISIVILISNSYDVFYLTFDLEMNKKHPANNRPENNNNNKSKNQWRQSSGVYWWNRFFDNNLGV